MIPQTLRTTYHLNRNGLQNTAMLIAEEVLKLPKAKIPKAIKPYVDSYRARRTLGMALAIAEYVIDECVSHGGGQ